jgi:flagellar motor switch protein FliN
MSELTPEIAAEVVAACRTNADEAAGALGRALDASFSLVIGEPTTYSANDPLPGCEGPGLAIWFRVGAVGAAVLAPQEGGLLPLWYASPDATGTSKLGALAQELSMLLLPETLMADSYGASGVTELAEALTAAGPAEGAAVVSLQVSVGERTEQWSLIWPLAEVDQMAGFAPAAPSPPAADEGVSRRVAGGTDDASQPGRGSGSTSSRLLNIAALPGFSRSLLKVQVAVSVQLAQKKETVQEIVELAPGTILKFDKSCDELLQLYAGNHPIAEGEAVKIGDKFGFRVTSMLLPQERFQPVRREVAS